MDADLLILRAAELIPCAGPATGVRGKALGHLDVVRDGALAVRDGTIVAVGASAEIERRFRAARVIDAAGRLVSPGLVDPHSHLLHGGARHDEYQEKITGRIQGPNLERGIASTVRATRAASDRELVDRALRDLDIAARNGTTTFEAKTGYGLDRDAELRLLRLTAGLEHAVEVVPTFLGAHVLPAEYADRRADYVDLVVDTLPEAARHAEFCDVCCDPVGFTAAECRRIGEAATRLGMGLRVHADQTGDAGGAELAARLGAAAADHLDHTSDRGFAALAKAGTVATLLPGVTLHLLEMTPRVAGGRLEAAAKPFMPLVARRAVDAGGVVALSTDYNPGSCPTPSMPTIMQLAARLYRLGYAEIWHMCTINAAAALRRGHDRGSLEPGKRADIVIWTEPEHGLIINRFGYDMVDTVLIAGETVVEGGRAVGDALRRRPRRPAPA